MEGLLTLHRLTGLSQGEVAKKANISQQYLSAILRDEKVPSEAIAQKLLDVYTKSVDVAAVKQTLTQELGTGPFQHHRTTAPSSAELDPDTDAATGLKVAQDGNGNYYLVDTTTDPPTVSPVQFSDAVQQAGQSLGSKAVKSDKSGPYRDGMGHKRNKRG